MKPTNVKRSDWLLYNTFYFAEHFLGRKAFLKIFGNSEKKLWKSIDEHASQCGFKNPLVVEEFTEGNYPETLWHPYNVRVFRGAAKDWICTQKWTFDHFSEVYGDKDVTLISNVGMKAKDSDQDYETIKLRDYIRILRSGSKKYLKFSNMVHDESSLYSDFNIGWLHKFQMSGKFQKLFYLFMGAKDTLTPTHCGMPPTVFVQIEGTKKWTFSPANDRIFMGVPAERRNYYYTNANPYELDDPNFPLLKHANRKEVYLEKGDVIWFPSFVWHYVENKTDSIGVAYKFVHIPSALTSSKMMTILFFLSTRPFLLQSFIMSKIKKKEGQYIFEKPSK